MMSFAKTLVILACSYLVAASPLDANAASQLFKRNGGSCADTSQFATPAPEGIANGAAFCETAWQANYSPMTNLTLWSDGFQVYGIQATYADGTQSAVIGNAQGNVGHIGVDYAQGQRWSSFALFYLYPQYGGGPYVTTIIAEASNGQRVDAGMNAYDRHQHGLDPYANFPDVGSGFLFGLQGTQTVGGGLNSIALLFLESTVSDIQFTDFSFPNGNIAIDSLASGHYYNSQTTSTSTWTLANMEAINTLHTFTSQVTNTYGTTETIGFSLSLPILKAFTASEMTAFMWSTAYTSVNTATYSKTVTVTWNEGGTLQPGQGVDASVAVGHGSGTFPYTCTCTLTLKNGYKFSFIENGELTIDDISSAVTTVTQANHP